MWQFAEFWGDALWASLTFGWLVFGAVSTALPAMFSLIIRYYPRAKQIKWIRWGGDHQAELHVTFAALCVLAYLAYAPYRSYSREQTARMEAEEKNKQPAKLSGVFSGALTAEGENGVAIVLPLLSITNTGPPTVVDIGTATIKCEGKTFSGLRNILYENGTSHVFQRGTETLTKSDMISEKLATPIPTGGRVSGWLLFELPDISRAELQRKDFEIVLNFKDASGNEYNASSPLIGAQKPRGEERYIPGFHNPFSSHSGEAPVPGEPTTPLSPTPDKEASPH